MSNALILPQPNAVLPALITERDALIAHVGTLGEATDVKSVDALNRALTQAGALVKKVEAYRKSYTAPLDDFKKLCMAQQEECLAPLTEIQSAIKTELANYQSLIAQQARDREAKRLEAEKKVTVETAGSRHVTPALVPMEAAPEVAKVNTRRMPRLVITNRAMIPPTFYDLNESRLKAWLTENEVNACLGAHIEYDDVVVTGRG